MRAPLRKIKCIAAQLSIALTLVCVFEPAAIASSLANCSSVFASAHFYPDSPQGFGEVYPALAHWKVRGAGRVVINREGSLENSSVMFDSAASDQPTLFSLKLNTSKIEHGDTATSIDKRIQESGRGLKLKLSRLAGHPHVTLKLIAQSYDKKTALTASAEIPVSDLDQLISLPWRQFRIDRNLQIKAPQSVESDRTFNVQNRKLHDHYTYDFEAGSAFEPSVMEILGYELVIKSTTKSDTKLQLVGSIYNDFDLAWLHSAPPEIVHAYQFRLPGSGVRSEVFSMFTRLYQRPEAIKYALNIVAQGEKAIARELEKISPEISKGYFAKLELVEQPDGKVSPEEFFAQFRFGFIPAPIEQGVFANYHGRYTHAAQLLALFYKATPEEMRQMAKTIGAFRNVVWRNLWNVFFDAPGADGPNAPRWWAELFRRYGIMTNPTTI
jgi:hypothetical protein